MVCSFTRDFILFESSEFFSFEWLENASWKNKWLCQKHQSSILSGIFFSSKYLEHSSLFFYENWGLKEAWLGKLTEAGNILLELPFSLSHAINSKSPTKNL